MAYPQQFFLQTRGRVTIALAALLALTGCTGDDGAVIEDTPAEPPEVLNIGVAMPSPGLISGINPTEVSGVEVDLAAAVIERMQTLPPGVEIQWVPTGADTVTTELADGELDLAIGQFSEQDFSADVARVGPYITAQPGVLIHQDPEEQDATGLEVLHPTVVDSFELLVDASKCVVADSSAATADLDGAVVEPSVAECEIGMRSGRYDVILADDVQLAGLLTDPVSAGRYELLALTDLVSATDDEVAAEYEALLSATRQYWLGASSDYCADASEALETAVADGVVEDLFASWDHSFQAEPVDATELTVENCAAED